MKNSIKVRMLRNSLLSKWQNDPRKIRSRKLQKIRPHNALQRSAGESTESLFSADAQLLNFTLDPREV
ncbi:MAG: hypothetical protein NTX50_22025 [Candidatus Sumerlaeota bacterium]|nr:hypothetical protein [Candidatus Sumerlaeota bacterium]